MDLDDALIQSTAGRNAQHKISAELWLNCKKGSFKNLSYRGH